MALFIVYVLIALGFSFLCSVLEAVLLSVTPAYVAQLQEERPKVGAKLLEMKNNVDRPLSAILSLNTVAHTVGAAGAGAQAQEIWPGSTAMAIVSAILTLLILIVSEIIPKTIGARYWRKLAPFSTKVIGWLIILIYPLVLISEQITKLLGGPGHGGKVSREEFAAMAKLGAEQGVFDESESRILTSLFKFGDLRTKDVMTPRTVVKSLSADETIGDAVTKKDWMRFSRIPIYGKNEDDVVGYVLKDQVLLYAARDELDTALSDLKRELIIVPDSIPLPDLLERLLDKRENIALVVTEFGGVAGVVSLEDVVETLLGLEIVDEEDAVQDMRELARQRWFARARRLGLVDSEMPPPNTDGDASATSSDDAASSDTEHSSTEDK